jgi:hypothetical protein
MKLEKVPEVQGKAGGNGSQEEGEQEKVSYIRVL